MLTLVAYPSLLAFLSLILYCTIIPFPRSTAMTALLEPTGLIEPEDATQNEVTSLRDALRELAQRLGADRPAERRTHAGITSAEPLTRLGQVLGSSPDGAATALRLLLSLDDAVLLHDETDLTSLPACPGSARLLLEVKTGRGHPSRLALPEAWSGALLLEVAQLLTGRSVSWGVANTPADLPDTLGTGQLATLLGVSRPTVQAALDRGDVPAVATPGGHRRVLRADALAWKARMERQRTSLRDLVQMTNADEHEGSSLPRGVVRSRTKRRGGAGQPS